MSAITRSAGCIKRTIRLTMDVYCPNCGEPFDQDEFHYMEEWNIKMTYDEARKTFFQKGCKFLLSGGEKNCDETREKRQKELQQLRERHLKLKDAWRDGLKAGAFVKNEYDLYPDQWITVKHPIDGDDCYSWDIETEIWTLSEEIRSLSSLTFRMSASGALYDILGDDIDGIASSL